MGAGYSNGTAIYYNNKGVVLWEQEKLEEALEQFRCALKIDEEQAPNPLTIAISYNNIGAVLFEQGKLEEASEQFRRALKIDERNRLPLHWMLRRPTAINV